MNLKRVVIVLALILVCPLTVAANTIEQVDQHHLQFGSWLAFGIVISAILISWFLNHAAPKIRALGSLLAAFACFALVIWFVWVLETEILANPKPSQTPMDAAKPALLWLQIMVAFVAGFILLKTGYRQSKNEIVLHTTVVT